MSKTISILVVLSIASYVSASYPGFLCPTPQNEKVFYPCELDCQHQHGSTYGYCGDASVGDYNCYCGPVEPDVSYPSSLLCAQEGDKYQKLCDVDCQCNHAGIGGECFYENKVCECYGMESENKYCEYATADDFAKFSADLVGSESAGQFATGFLEGAH